MSYQVIARKWRPQTFDDVVGQQHVTRTLQNALRSDRLAHAFLFSGVRGVGKTTTARILAKALNCRKGPTPEPCGTCVSCSEIAEANSVDVLEIDAASNRGIDNIRELRESVRYGTARDRFKIFIIDEVHMLTNEAFNALLKTLEEPPPHVKFILATTEYHKIPATITSRCQQYEFKPIPFTLILERLRQIAESEGIQASDYALRTIATAAHGSMRDAQSALDQIIAFSGKTIQDEEVQTLLGVVDEALVAQLLDAILERDRAGLLRQMQGLQEHGVPAQNFCRKWLEYVRHLMVCKVAGWDQHLLHLPDSYRETLQRQAERVSELDLLRFYDLLQRTENELRWQAQPYVHLEMSFLKLVELAQLPTLEEIIGRLEGGKLPVSGQAPAFSGSPEGASSPSGGGKPASAGSARAPQPASSREDLISRLLSARPIEESPRLFTALQHASEIHLCDRTLRINFPPAESFHRNVVEEEDNLQRLKGAVSALLGFQPDIETRVNRPAEAEAGEEDPTQHPRVRDFMEKFPGKVIVEKIVEE